MNFQAVSLGERITRKGLRIKEILGNKKGRAFYCPLACLVQVCRPVVMWSHLDQFLASPDWIDGHLWTRNASIFGFVFWPSSIVIFKSGWCWNLCMVTLKRKEGVVPFHSQYWRCHYYDLSILGKFNICGKSHSWPALSHRGAGKNASHISFVTTFFWS